MVIVIPVICGPTAGGKSALALDMAAARDGVIVNADSMQVYEALPILTAQPSADERAQIPHTLYGVLGPGEKCTAQHWRELAIAAIRDALAQGQTPIIVGGTGLYIRTLTEGLSPIPDIAPDFRQRAISLQEEMGNPAFHAHLARLDPVMAGRLHPNDSQRLIRALEVLEGTGRSLSHWQALPVQGPPEGWRFETQFINPPRPVLHDRCNSRFTRMIEAGALDEVKALDGMIRSGAVPADAPVTCAIGYRVLRDVLRGEMSLEQAVERGQAETRQYARRQITWFGGRTVSHVEHAS